MTKEIFYIAIAVLGIAIVASIIGMVGPSAQKGIDFIAGVPLAGDRARAEIESINTQATISKTLASAQANKINAEADALRMQKNIEMQNAISAGAVALENTKAGATIWSTFWQYVTYAIGIAMTSLGVSYIYRTWAQIHVAKHKVNTLSQLGCNALALTAQTGGSVIFTPAGEIKVEVKTPMLEAPKPTVLIEARAKTRVPAEKSPAL